MMRRFVTVAVIIFVGVAGCAEIQHTATPEQALDTVLIAGVGDVVLRIEKKRNLENVLGRSDVFGRQTNEGFVELRYAGMEPSGAAVLARRDVEIFTNETTMSRTPVSQTTTESQTVVSGAASGSATSMNLGGVATTSSTSTTIAPIEDFHVVVPSDAIAVRLAPSEKTLPVAGYVVSIVRVTNTSFVYTISRQ